MRKINSLKLTQNLEMTEIVGKDVQELLASANKDSRLISSRPVFLKFTEHQ